MVKVSILDVKIGDRLARPIINGDGTILLNKDIILTSKYLYKLKSIGIPFVYIRRPDGLLDDVKSLDPISDATRMEALRNVNEVINSVQISKQQLMQDFSVAIDNIVHEVMNNPEFLFNLTEIRSLEGWLFSHSVNSGVIAAVIGKGAGLDYHQMKEVVMGVMLHDIGKIKLPNLVNIPETEWSADDRKAYLTHAAVGHRALRERFSSMSSLAAAVPYQHHENYDGTGFPQRLRGEAIHLYSRICAVANLYDRLGSGVVGVPPVLPHEACEILMGLSTTQLDFNLVQIFMRNVAIYPNGLTVELSTGETGIVVAQNMTSTRPVVRVIKRDEYDFRSQFEEVDYKVKDYDLSRHLTIMIKKVVGVESESRSSQKNPPGDQQALDGFSSLYQLQENKGKDGQPAKATAPVANVTAAPAKAPPVTTARPSVDTEDADVILDKIAKLKKLLDMQAITAADYEIAKKRLLSKL